MSSSLVGRTLGKYEIVESLGHGGMATVYKGYQRDVDRNVAVKVLPPHPGQDPQFVERFRLEARNLGNLQHPHILSLYDYGVEDDIFYLVLQYVEGGTFSDLIKRGPMLPETVAPLLSQSASALDYAHRRGIIHRDIKPENILLDSEGHVMLADFGIAKILGGDTNLTGTGGIVGTPAYMAPEQGMGMAVTSSVDIYSLGVVVYELLTGQQPYTAETPMQVLLKHVQEPVPEIANHIAGLPFAIEEVMRRVLAKEPQDRYTTIIEFSEDFKAAVQGEVTTRETQPPKPVVPTPTKPSIPAERNAQATTVDLPAPGAPTLDIPAPGPVREQPITQQPTTVVVQQGGSNMILIGGFAIIALLVAIIGLLVVTSLNDTGDDAGPPPPTRAAVIQATSTPQVVAVAPDVRTFGQLSYGSASGIGDSITMQVSELAPPASGEIYAAWLFNSTNGAVLSLGELTLDAVGNGALSFSDSESRVLPADFNALLVTAESELGAIPAGEVLYSAQVPPEASSALGEILVASPNGIEGGSLLAGATAEGELALIHTSIDHVGVNLGGLLSRTEHTVNILMNTQQDYDGNGRPENPGFGFGLALFLDLMDEQLTVVAEAPTINRLLQGDVERVRSCIQNTRGHMNNLIELEQSWIGLTDESLVEAQVLESVDIMDSLLQGVDLNNNGRIEAFPGECALGQIANFSLLLGNMALVEGPLTLLDGATLPEFVPDGEPLAEPTVVAAAAPTAITGQTFGRLSFTTASAPGDSVTLRVEGLAQPSPGNSYGAWLQDATGRSLLLGEVDIDPLGDGVLQFTHPDGVTLPAEYNRIVVAEESTIGADPPGAVAYSGNVPAALPEAVEEILVESRDGIDGGSLLDGALTEATIGAQHAGLAANATNIGALHTHAEHTLNILQGLQEDFDGSGRGSNPGRGIGVPFFLDLIEEQLDAAISGPDASLRLQSEAELIRVCVDNTRQRVDQVLELENVLVAAADLEAVRTEMAEAADVAQTLISGADFNGNGQIEPFEGECGLEQITEFGVLVGSMDLLAGE